MNMIEAVSSCLRNCANFSGRASEGDVMSSWYEGAPGAAFKPVAGGYLFQSRNPWLIGPSRRYLVTEAQKAEIVAQLLGSVRRARPWMIPISLAISLAMMGLFFIVMNWLRSHQMATEGALVAFVVVLTAVPIVALHVVRMRTLAPLVADLPTTTERMTFRDRIEHYAMKASYRLLILTVAIVWLMGALLGAIVVVDAIYEGRINRNFYPLAAVAVLSVPYGLIFLYFAMLKRKLARQAS
jgi:hypothetical protein